jgi:hypothetical protein
VRRNHLDCEEFVTRWKTWYTSYPIAARFRVLAGNSIGRHQAFVAC